MPHLRYQRCLRALGKIEKAVTGSKVTVYTGNNMAKQGSVNDMFRWASGDTKCTKGWII